MKAAIFIFSWIGILSSCTPTLEEQDPTYHFAGTTRVEIYGDSIRLEYEDSGRVTINHYLRMDTTGKVVFINNSVTVNNMISQTEEIITSKDHSYRIGEYNLVYFHDSIAVWDTLSILNEIFRNGNFNCYINGRLNHQVYIMEQITEGNGTYGNLLYLINPTNNEAFQFFDHYDPSLSRSAVWNWKQIKPKTWKQYKNTKTAINRLSKALSSSWARARIDTSIWKRFLK